MTEPTDDRDVSTIMQDATIEPPDDFRTSLADRIHADLATPDAPASAGRDSTGLGRRGRVLLAAAAIVILIAGLVFVTGRSNDGTVELDPAGDLDPDALRGDDLFDELEGRRWLALERFDDPSPTVLTSDVTFTGSAASPEIVGHDGCNAYGGTFTLPGASIEDASLSAEGEACDVDVLTLEAGQQIELLPDADSFVLRADDGTQIARFTDLATLIPATADDLPGVWLVDDLERVEFTFAGRGIVTLCTWLTWEERGDGVVVRLDTELDGCSDVEGRDGLRKPSRVTDEIRELTTDGANVYRSPAGLLLVGELGAIELRTLPTVEARLDQVTIAAGALFGIEPGAGVSPDDVIEAVEPFLGAPDQDTGWVDHRNLAAPIQTCGLNNYREIAWGDLVTGFWGTGTRSVLLFWSVGDRRIIGVTTPESELTPSIEPSGLMTEHGVGIGDPIDAIPDRFNITRTDWGTSDERFDPGTDVQLVSVASQNPRATGGNLEPASRSGGYLVIDGTVAGFGAADFQC
jgi:hypothetical protein